MGFRRGEAPLRNSLPSPLSKGRGIKGEGLIKQEISTSIFEQPLFINIAYTIRG